jgi:hypothetical protein
MARRGGEWPATMGINASSYCVGFGKGNRGGQCGLMEEKERGRRGGSSPRGEGGRRPT